MRDPMTLFGISSAPSVRPRRQRRSPERRRRLLFEGLEPRIVLASTASLSSGDLLVMGDSLANHLTFSSDGTNLVVTDSSGITAAGSGVTQDGPNAVRAWLADITGRLDVDGGDGTDTAALGTVDLRNAGIRVRGVETVSVDAAASATAVGGLDIEADSFTANAGATVSTRKIAAGDPGMADSTGASGDLSIVAHHIDIQAGSRLLAQVEEDSPFEPGKVVLKVDRTTVALPFIPQVSLADISITIGAGGSGAKAEIRGGEIEIEGAITNHIGSPKRVVGYTDQTVKISIENASIEGESVTVAAEAEDTSLLEEAPDWLPASFIEAFEEFLVDKFLPKTPISAMVRGAKATVSLVDSEVRSAGGVTLDAKSFVDATTEALATHDHIIKKMPSHFSAGYSQGQSTATTTVGGDSTIVAGGDVTIGTDARTTAVVTARTTSNINLHSPASARDVVVSLAITNSSTTSQALIEEDATINAGGNVNITSAGTVKNNAKSGATTYIDGAGGLSVSLAFDTSDIQATADGQIAAAGAEVTRTIDLGNVSGNTMTIPNHGFHDGQIVDYRAGDPDHPIGGLLNGEKLRVIVVDQNTIQLARVGPMEIDNTGADPVSTQTFSRRNTVLFNPQTAVDPSQDAITLNNHGFSTGQRLDYGVSSDADEAIGGLEDQTAYFVIRTGPDTFRLAATQEAATAATPVPINLTSKGAGTSHIFGYHETEKSFAPSTDFDNATDTFAMTGHGFATGDALVYATDPTPSKEQVISRNAVFDPTNRTSTFDPTGTVDLDELVVNISTNTIALVNHLLWTNQQVTYHTHGGDPIGGLTDGATYFVIKVDDRYIQLAETGGGAAIDLKAGATLGSGAHELKTPEARTLSFDPNGTVAEPVVNQVTETVLIAPFHNYVAGQRVRYETGGGAPIGWLNNNEDYFVIPVNEAAFQLARSRADALAGVAINLAWGATGTNHRFTTNEVDTIDDLIVSPSHEMETGEKVTYRKGEGDAIAPLADGAQYFVIRLDENTFRLANTLGEASAGTFIDITSTGSGTMQGFERDTVVSTFDPTRTVPVVDTTNHTIELPGHGLNAGDKVNYQASGGAPIGGLADNTNYFVIRVDGDHIQLAASSTAATNGDEIPLGVGATLGSGLHVFRVIPEVEIAEFPDRTIDFDPTLSPALDAAANTIRLPNHRLSTADPLTYLSGSGTPIGGLSNGTEYFAIVVDDDTIQLAASAGGTAVDLSGGATGDRHGLQRRSTITRRDPPLRGLNNGEIYFAIVLDANHFRLAESEQDALAAAPIALAPSPGAGTVHSLKGDNEETGVLVAADLSANNRATSGAAIGSEPTLSDLLTKAELQGSLAAIKGILKFNFKDQFKKPDINGSGTTTNSLFSAAGGLSLNLFDHTVRATLGSTAEIDSDGNVTLRSSVSQKSQTTAQGNLVLGSAKKFASGVALALGFYTNDVQSIVDGDGGSGASIDAAGQIDISSDVEYPLLVEPLQLLPFSSFFDSTNSYDVIGDISNFLNGSLGLTRIMNVWSASKAYTTKAASLPKVAFCGSIGYTGYTNTSQAIVRGGAQLNQQVQNANQKVTVTAATGMELVNVTGIMHLKLNGAGLFKAYKDFDPTTVFNFAGNFFSFFGNKSSTLGVGGSLMIQSMDNTTTALIEDGAAVYSGANGGLEVSSNQDIYSFEFAQSGGESGSIGVSASIVWVDQTSHTIAQLASGVQVTGGPVNVIADDQTTHTSLAGSAQLAKRLGIGVGFALLDVDRTTLAVIGKRRTDEDDSVGSAGTAIDVSSLNLQATSTGDLWSFGLVGALASNIPVGAPAQRDGHAGPVEATSGVALVGDAAVNTVADTTQAYINDDGTIRSGDIRLTAHDDTSMSTVTGAGAIGAKPDGTIGTAAAGSFSYNDLDLTTEAFVIGPTIPRASEITVAATSDGSILAISAGLAGAVAKTSVTIAGSFSWNEIDNTVRAYVDRTLMQQLTNLTLSADDTSTVQADGGAASIAISRAKDGLGGAVAFGVSAAVNNLTPTVQAYVTESTVTNAAGVIIGADSTADVTAITWAGDLAGAASGESGLQLTGAGAGSGNTITTTVEAKIRGGSDVSTVSGGDVRLTALDTASVEANAGGVAVDVMLAGGTNVAVAIGAAVASNEITDGTIEAAIDDSTVKSGGRVVLEANSEPQIDAQAISLSVGFAMSGGADAGIPLDGAGAGSGNEIHNTTAASITGSSTVKTVGAGSVSLAATDTSRITAVAPAISLSFDWVPANAFTLEVGISMTSNEISNTLKAYVDDSTVDAGGDLIVQADSTATSDSVPVAAVPTLTISQAISISLSGVGAHAFNTVSNGIEASVTGGSLVTVGGDVRVTARDDATINANVVAATITVNISSGEEVTGNVAIAAALATNKLGIDDDRNTVRAFIQDSSVTAGGAIDVSATSTADITGLTVGTGLSVAATSGIGFAVNGFGAETRNTVRSDVEAAILGSSNVRTTGVGNITLNAVESSESTIEAKATGGSLSGAGSGSSFSGALTIGVVLAETDVADNVLAHIDQATVRAGGNIEMDARSASSVDSLTVFVSLSITVGSSGSIAGAGDGANSTNTIRNTIEAYILDSNSTVTTTGAGSVLLSATDNSTANAQAGGGNFALALGSSFGGSISVGAVLATNDIENTVQAYLFNSTVSAAGDVQLTTVSRPKIIATTVAVALSGSGTADGLAAAGAAGASQSKNTISSTIAAHITDSTVTADGAVTVSSTADKPASGHNINATAPAVSVGVAATDPMEGVAFALTGAGGNVINESTSGIRAFIGGSSTVVAAGEVSVGAADATTMDGKMIAVTVALSEFAGSIAVALVTNTHANDVQGYIDRAAVSSTAGAISVTADSSPTATAMAVPVAVSVEASGDGANATSNINGSVAAFVDQGATLTAGGGTVTVQANSAADTQADTGGGSLSILLTVTALLANASIGQTAKAYVSGGSTVTAAALDVMADSTKAHATANVDAVSAGLIAGAGGRADAEISGDVIAFVGAESGTRPPAVPTNIQLGSGTLTVRAKAESTTAHADASGGSGGPTVEVSVLVPFAEVTSDTKAYVGEGTTLGAGALTVDADAHLTANATSLVVGISGFTGDGVDATAKITGDSRTAAFIGPAGGTTPSGDTTAITLSGGDASVTATLTGLATTDITVGSGAIVVAADGTTVNSAMSGCVDAYLGDNTHLTTPGDVTVHSTSHSRADATSMGVNAAAAGPAAYGTKTTATLNPTLTAFTGSGVLIAAHDVSVLVSHNVDGAGAPLADKKVRAKGTAGSGSLLLGGAGANVQGTVSPAIDTRLGTGTTVVASGTVTVASRSYQFADVDANSVGAAGIVAVGVTLATGNTQGTINTHIDGHIDRAHAVVLQAAVAAETDAFGEANGGAIGGAGVGTNVNATVGDGDVDHPLVATYVGGSGRVHSTGDIDIQSLLTTDCVATSSGYAFSGVASVGSLPATSTVQPVVRTRIDAGAQVTSSDGNVRVLSGHNYDAETGDFLSDKETLVSTSNTSASLGVKVDDTTITADAKADVATRLAEGAIVNATAGRVDVEARSSNLADAHLTNDGGALITFRGIGNARGKARGTTSTEVLGKIETAGGGAGANHITALAQASDIANGQIRQHVGGGVSVNDSTAEATATPAVSVTVGGTLRAASNINVDADSFTDADATIDNTSGGAINVTDYRATVTATPDVAATVADNAVLAAGNTISVSANHGRPATGLSDGTFDAVTQVDTNQDTISFTHDHGLQTGAAVTYDALDQAAIGGLGDGRTYGVIVTGDKSLQLGDTFLAQEPASGNPVGIDVVNDTIVFPAPHNLQGDGRPGTSDRVIYTVLGGSIGVGGLQDGKTYLVSVVDATTIRLVDPDTLPAAPLALAGTNIGVDNQTITISNHGFVSEQPVTYTAPAPAVTSSFAMDVVVVTDEFGHPISVASDASANNIYFGAAVMAEQGFHDGDLVIYTAGIDPNTGLSAPIGGLISGRRYAVLLDPAQPNQIQLTEQNDPLSTPIELNPAEVSVNVPQMFLKVNDQPIGGLTDQQTYYVVQIDADNFQLAPTLADAQAGTNLVTLDPTDPVTGNVLTGARNTLGTRGVDLTGVGSGRQQLVIDLTSPGSGQQRLMGIGGASGLAGAPSGDGIATASVSSGGGGPVSVDSAHTTAASQPTSTLTIGQAAHLDATSIALASSSAGNVGGSTDNNDGGFVAVAKGDSSISSNNAAGVVVKDAAILAASQDVEITSTSSQSASTLTDISSKGFAGVPKANATATVDYESKIDIYAATLTAGKQMIIEARSNLAGAVTVNSDGRGAGSGSHANDSDDNDKGLFIGNTRALTQTTVDDGASLTAETLALKATVTSVNASVEAVAYGDGLGGNSNAEARLHMTDTTAVILDPHSHLTADVVNLAATHDGIVVTSHSDSTCDCGGGADNSTAETDYESYSQVTGYQFALITTSNLTVSVDQKVTKYDRDEDHGGGFLVFGDHNEDGHFNAYRKISWEATVELAHDADLELAVDSNGLITADTGVTVTTDTGQSLNVGDTVPEGQTIVVQGVANAGSGKVVFEANVPSKQDGESPPNGEISGHLGVFEIPSSFGSVQISNASSRALRIDGLEVGSGTDPADAEITIDVQKDSDFSFDVRNGAAPTTFTIENTHPTAAPLLIVNGLIDNPIGVTTITNASGDLVATGDQAIVRTNRLTLLAPLANIGQTGGVIGDHRVNVQLVQSAGRPTSLETRAGRDSALSIQGLLRELTVTDFRPNIDLIAAGGDVDVLLLAGLLQTTAGGGGVSTSVGETAHVLPPPYSPIISVPPASFPVPPRVTTVVDHWPPAGGGPPPVIDLGLQGTGTTTIDTTYEFTGTFSGQTRRLQAGNDILFQGCATAGCGTATSVVSVLGNTVLTSLTDGLIHGNTNGSIDLTEVVAETANRALRVGVIESTGRSVTLTVPDTAASGEDLVLFDDSVASPAGSRINAANCVTLEVGDNLFMAGDYSAAAVSSQINAGTTVLIRSDRAVPDPDPGVGSLLDLRGVIYANLSGTITAPSALSQVVQILTGDDADIVSLTNVTSGTGTTVWTFGANDLVQAGSKAMVAIGGEPPASWDPQNTGGVLDGILAQLTVQGGDRQDTLDLDDSGNAGPSNGVLTSTTISGVFGAGGVSYGTFEFLNVDLGSGGDTFTVEGTHAGTTTVATHAGADTVNVRATQGTLLADTGGETCVNTVNVGSLAPDSGGVLDAIQGQLTVAGNRHDALNVDDTGNTMTKTGTLTPGTLTGLDMGPLGIRYSGVAVLKMELGSGADALTISGGSGLFPPDLTVDARGGTDQITVTADLILGQVTDGHQHLGRLTLRADGIHLNAGTISTSGAPTAGDVLLDGAVTLGADALVNTDGAEADGNIDFTGTITGTAAGAAETLTMTLGAGTLNAGAICGIAGGSADAAGLTTVTLNSAGTASFHGAINVRGDVTQGAGTGTTSFSGGGGIGGALSVTTHAIAVQTAALTVTGAVGLDAVAGVAIDAPLSGSSITVDADSDDDAAGAFSNTAGVSTGGGTVRITASDVAISAAIDATLGGRVILAPSTAVAIGLGAGGAFTLEAAGADLINAAVLEIDAHTLAAPVTFGADTQFTTGGQTVRSLVIRTASTVTGTAGGVVVPDLGIVADGTVNLTDPNTSVSTVAINTSNDAVAFVAANGFTVGTVDGGNYGLTGIDGATIQLTAATGNVTVQANVAGSDAVNVALSGNDGLFTIAGAASVSTSANGLTVRADKMHLAGTLTASGQIVTLQNSVGADAIDLGSTTDAALHTLELSDDELDRITAETLRIGSLTSGAIGITAAGVGPDNVSTAFSLIAGAGVEQTGTIRYAHGLRISAAGPVTLAGDNDVGTLAAAVGGSDNAFTFRDVDDLIIGSADTVAGVNTNHGAIDISTTDGDLTISNAAGTDVGAGTSTIVLTAGTASQTHAARRLVIESGATVAVTGSAGGGITLKADSMDLSQDAVSPGLIDAGTRMVTIEPFLPGTVFYAGGAAADADGDPDVLGINDIELANLTAGTLNLSAGSGDFHFLGTIGTGTGTLIVSTGGAVLDDNAANPDVWAAAAILTAVNGIGFGTDATNTTANPTDYLDIEVSHLDVNNTGTASGQVKIANTGALVLTDLDGSGPLTVYGANPGAIRANSPYTISSSVTHNTRYTHTAGNSTSDGDDLTINHGAVVTLASATDATLTFESGDDILLGDGTGTGKIETVNASGHAVILDADKEGAGGGDSDRGSVTQTAASGTCLVTNQLTIVAAQDETLAGAIGTAAQALLVRADRLTTDTAATGTSGNQFLTEADGVAIVTMTAGSGDLTLSVSAGGITDGLVGEAANLTAGRATLNAEAGIGDPDDINTQVGTLAALNSGTGSIGIDQVAAGGAIQVNQAAQTSPSDAGSIHLRTAAGTITIAANQQGVSILGAGSILLEAHGTGSDVVLNAAVSASGGSLAIHADRDVLGDAAGDLTNNGGAIDLWADADNSGLGSNDDGTIQMDGDINAGTGVVTFRLSDCDGSLNGDLDSAGDVIKNGRGALRLNSLDNGYTGTTHVNAGTLLINGRLTADTDTVSVNSGGTLGGRGIIGTAAGARDVLVRTGGFLAPGDVDPATCSSLPGRLTVNGDVTLESSASYRVQLQGVEAGTQYDQLRVNGFVNLTGPLTAASGPELELLDGFTMPLGAEFRIIDNDSNDRIDTRFKGLPEGGSLSWNGYGLSISYYAGEQANDVVLGRPAQLDFNGFYGYTADGHLGVSPFQGKDGNEFGWAGTLLPQYFERNWPVAPPYATADEKWKYDGQATDNMGTPLTFQVDVAAGKTYDVMIFTGDTLWNHDREQFTVSGSKGTTATVQLDTWGAGAPDGSGVNVVWGGGVPNPGAGFYRWVRLTVTVGGSPGDTGTVSVTLQDLGGWDPTTVILGMDIRPVTAVGQMALAAPAPLPADGVSWDTYTGSGAPPNTVLTVTAFAPNTLTPPADNSHYLPVEGVAAETDSDVAAFGTQIRSDASGNFSFRALRPSLTTPVTFTVEEPSGLSRVTVTQTYTAPPDANALRFDFGVYGSPVQAGFLQVVPQTIYSATRGYGWLSRVAGVDRKDNVAANPATGSDLRRDLNYAKDATFKVALPDGTYSVRIYHSNPKYYGSLPCLADNFDVYAEGTLQYNVPDIPAGTTDVRTFTVTVSGGALELRLQDLGGRDGNFVVSGLDISSAALPGESPLLAAGGPREEGAAAISGEQLERVAAAAAAWWTAAGLTAQQAATLAQVQYAVADFGGAYLGLANPATNTVRIDDDAAGLGWGMKDEGGRMKAEGGRMKDEVSGLRSLNPEPRTLNPGIDLLTVVLHELGHLLGYEHAEAGLMAPVLAASPLASASRIPDLVSRLDEAFADLGRSDATDGDGGEGAALLRELQDMDGQAAATVQPGERVRPAHDPRGTGLQCGERERDVWFAELAASDEKTVGQ